MPIEAAASITTFNQLWPLGTDPKSQGDDHLRLIKAILKSCFDDDDPNTFFAVKINNVPTFRIQDDRIQIRDTTGQIRLQIQIDMATNTSTWQIISAGGTTVQILTVTSTGISLSNGGGVFTDSNIAANAAAGTTAFPIGTTILAVHAVGNTVARGQSVAPRLDAASAQTFTLDVSGNPTLLAGSWQSRGASAVGSALCLAQRIA
jgi:hypothetical protein